LGRKTLIGDVSAQPIDRELMRARAVAGALPGVGSTPGTSMNDTSGAERDAGVERAPDLIDAVTSIDPARYAAGS
jgi:hypothetical protein